ncbi:MAG: hypothetical protein IPP49_20555 [Saprospiraceae bacterium]|nr:hypothetical protein [Saprospiraceae bacterium]
MVLIIAVCALQFAYFIPTNRVENAADQYAMKVTGKTSVETSNTDFKLARGKIPRFSLRIGNIEYSYGQIL